MVEPCPLIFEPILKPKVWGGDNLGRLLGKRVPLGERIGESWECADLETGQSVVARGPAKGQSLHDLTEAWGKDLLGRVQLVDGRFPLLIKFLDAADNLSIQVHPDSETAQRLGGRVRVKHEAWHVIEAAEGACIYRGLTPETTVETVRRAMAERPEALLELLQRIPVRRDQTYFLPSGTVHALGAGVVVAEVQTPSDVTYRLYDWGRERPANDAGLHVEEGLSCIREGIDFSEHEKRSHVASIFTTVTRLITCPSFKIEKVRFVEGMEQEIPYAEPVCWIVLAGEGSILFGKSGAEPFGRGDVVLLPAGLKNGRLQTRSDCLWLEVTIPTKSDLAAYPRPDRASLQAPSGHADQPMQLNIDVDRSAKG